MPREPLPRGAAIAESSTRDALMDAALDLLDEQGVLAGLKIRAVADRAGVTPANVYHLFGSRQGLLRAALARETARLADALAIVGDLPFVERRVRMFDVIAAHPRLRLTALLAIDADPDYRPLPFLEATRVQYRAQVERGDLPADFDIDAAHTLGVAVAIAVAIYGEAAARQLGIAPESLRSRMRDLLETMLDALATGETPGGT